MIDLFLALSPCQQPDVLQIIRIIKTIMKIICIVIPICVFIFVTIDFVKNVIASSEKDIEGNTKLAIKRILMGVAVFLVPTIVMAVNNMLGSLGVDYASCLTNATKAGIAKAKVNYKAYQESLNNQINNTINNNKEDKPSSGGTVNRNNGFSNLKGHKEDNNSSGSGDNSGGTTGGNSGGTIESGGTVTDVDTDVVINKQTLFVGDSRTVGMCNAKGVGGYCVAKEGQGLKWLKTNMTQQTITNKLKDKTYKVMVISLGINDLGYINDYIKYYKEMANKYTNVKIIVTSVTRVFDEKSKSIKNDKVRMFNDSLKSGLSGSKVTYCDIYTPTFNSLKGASDGIHYDNASYKKIYNAVAQCVNNN